MLRPRFGDNGRRTGYFGLGHSNRRNGTLLIISLYNFTADIYITSFVCHTQERSPATSAGILSRKSTTNLLCSLATTDFNKPPSTVVDPNFQKPVCAITRHSIHPATVVVRALREQTLGTCGNVLPRSLDTNVEVLWWLDASRM